MCTHLLLPIPDEVNKSKCKLSCTYKENSTEIEYCKEDCEQHHAKPKNNGGSSGSSSGGGSSTSGGSSSGGGSSTSGGSSSGGGSSTGGSSSGGGGWNFWQDLFGGGSSSGNTGTDTWNGEQYCNANNICSNVNGGASAWDGNLGGNTVPSDQCGGGKNSNDGSWNGCFECLGDGTWCKDLTTSTDTYIEICVGGEGSCAFQDDTGKDCTVVCNPLNGQDCYDSNGNDCISPYCAISSLGMPTPSPTGFTSNDTFTTGIGSAIESAGPIFGTITVCGVALIATLALRKVSNFIL